jgi:hypothetical protein
MASKYPKFDKKIDEMISVSEMQRQKTRIGVIASYDKRTNTARVLLEDRFSDQITDVLTGVSCPMIQRNSKCCTRDWNTMPSCI